MNPSRFGATSRLCRPAEACPRSTPPLLAGTLFACVLAGQYGPGAVTQVEAAVRRPTTHDNPFEKIHIYNDRTAFEGNGDHVNVMGYRISSRPTT